MNQYELAMTASTVLTQIIARNETPILRLSESPDPKLLIMFAVERTAPVRATARAETAVAAMAEKLKLRTMSSRDLGQTIPSTKEKE